MKREKVMRGIKKLFCTVLILSLCFGYVMPVRAAESEISQYKISGYPKFPVTNRKYFVIYKEGWRNNRTEICFFNIKGKTSKTYVSWPGSGRITIANGTFAKDDVKYYLKGNKWVKFETNYGTISNHGTKILKSNLDCYSNGKRIVKATAVNYIRLSKTKVSLSKGDRITLSAKTNISGKVTYKSDKPKIVSVDKKGRITAKKKGTATITATASNGKKATCKVTVK